MRLGVFADVHGNLLALEAVLHRLESTAVDTLVNLGDCVSGPLWPAECVRLLQTLDCIHVRGNHDRWVGAVSPDGLGKSDSYTWSKLSPTERDWLWQLPSKVSFGQALAFHGTPADDNSYLLETAQNGQLVLASRQDICERMGQVPERLLLCGHSHLHRLISLDDHLIVNPGSVGCPGYDDPAEPAHVSESGAPHARAAIVDLSDDGRCNVEFLQIDYNWHAASRRAAKNGRDDWAFILEHGWVA